MPSSRPFTFPTNHPSFLKHRFSAESPRFALNLNLSKPIPSPAWASLPTPPMSGTPPPDAASDPSQLAGRRRKREDTPPHTSDAPPTTTTVGISPLVEQTAQRYGEPTSYGRAPEHGIRSTTLASPWEPQMPYAAGLPAMNMPAFGGGSLPIGQSQISPHSTRKTKAHVASACVNCKKKHLRCDESRPCRRCVQSGKEDTCRDVEHKKRGRPPLKPDDPSSTRQSRPGSVWAGPGFPTSRGMGNAPVVGSGYPPLLPQPTPRPTSMFGFPPYAAPTIAQSSATAMGQFSHQRHSSYPSIPSGPSFTIPPSVPPHYQYAPQGQSMMPPQNYGASLFPRTLPHQQDHTQPSTSYYDTSSLQLPPILPAIQGIQPENTTMQPQAQYLSPAGGHQQLPGPSHSSAASRSSQERDSKRPRMDIGDVLHPRHD